ncbi:TonB-dependent receptor [Hymenobacter sp. 5516J-16]|uniref:TonB-dependent receptor n=1 Tax=Hymenobacter sp. 5516J-16 TaxID=2932253 RepID=UPI0021D48478|nr:TonB-dependent receptor [Hymenobacter sp. 5516J-16]
MNPTFTRVWLVLTCLVFCTIHTTWGQTATAALGGTVVSVTGSPVAGAAVTAIHLPTGLRRAAATDSAGIFSIPDALVGGPFAVQVTQPSFRTQVITNVFLSADKAVQLSIALAPDVVQVGTRRIDRTVLESAVPVDVIDMRELLATGPQTDLTQILNYSVPSFNSTRQTSADGADHVDPSSLRGLSPDQMLVLVNGKRRHTTALINLLGSRGVGNVGYDLNTVSSNAIDRIEVLRDGAAAQYGSDAIAGVMNINLRADNKGGNVLLSTGITSAGDGLSTLLSLNKGFKLGQKGFLNLTGDVDYRGATTRQYSRSLNSWPVFSSNRASEDSALAANGKTYRDFEQVNGDAKIRNYRLLYNLGAPLSNKVSFYSFGGFNYRRGRAVAPWVLPSAQPADIVDSIFPLGYQPNINTRIHDASGAAGITASLGQWKLDVSHVVGLNRMHYDVSNTLNSTLGTASPTQFDAGGLQFRQNVTNATLSRLFPQVLAGTNVAFGTEYRTENYLIFAGEEASWKDYGRGATGASGGAQGFIGFDPAAAIEGNRNNIGGFVDVEADITKKWTIGTAVRFENYSDFGSAFIYKLNTRLQLAKFLSVRAGYNTGFRAPSLQQALYRQLTLLPVNNGVVYTGIFNNQSEVTRAAGIPALQPEKSRNFSAGLILTPSPALTFTVDAYQIAIDDRIILSGLLGQGITPALDAALTQANATNAQFFTNAVNTRTQGLDLVASYRRPVGRGNFLASLAANFNRNTIRSIDVPTAFAKLQSDDDLGNNYVDQRQLSLIETGNPKSKLILNTSYEVGKFNLLVRNVRYGQVSSYDFNFDPLAEGSYYLVFKPRLTTDLQLSYKPKQALQLTAGVNNLFNVQPNTIAEAARNGNPPIGFKTQAEFDAYFQNKYGQPSYLPYDFDILPYHSHQMNFNGTFFYLKAVYNFGL